jgi:hypothetical protein
LQTHEELTIIKLFKVWQPHEEGQLLVFEAQLHPIIAKYPVSGLQIPFTGVEL